MKVTVGAEADGFFMPAITHGTLYHQPASLLRGSHVLPLNELRNIYPELWAAREHKRGSGPDSPAQRVPPLDCTWGDVVFLSPVHPQPLFDALRRSGRAAPLREPWTLSAELLDPARTVIRLMRAGVLGHHPDPADDDDYLPFTTANLRAVSRITVDAIRRLEGLQSGDPWLPWVDVPHILYRGEIPTGWFRSAGVAMQAD